MAVAVAGHASLALNAIIIASFLDASLFANELAVCASTVVL